MGASVGTVKICVRVSKDTKSALAELTTLYARDLGFKMSQSQAVEKAITESLRRLRSGCEKNDIDLDL